MWLNLSTEKTIVFEAPTAQEPVELPPLTLVTRTVRTASGQELTFQIAEPFNIAVAAEDLGRARFMAMSPDGRLFVPDLVDYNLSRSGKIFILDDFNATTGRFKTKHTYLSGLRGPNSVAFYTDEDGQDWIYIALTAHLIRYPYKAGDITPSGQPEIIVNFPNTQTPGQASVVWHITRTLAFHEGRLYIAVGSGCNACEQPPGEMRGLVFSINPDGSDAQIYADGLRNAVGIEWAEGTLYATENGADHLGVGAPDDLMYKLERGLHYGWPYCYETDGEILENTSTSWNKDFSCQESPRSFVGFEPHSAPLGLRYFRDAHLTINNSFLVALHGSFQPEVRAGYKVIRVSPEGEQELFMSGFQTENGTRISRPVDFLQKDAGSFFLSDDYGGRIFYIYAH